MKAGPTALLAAISLITACSAPSQAGVDNKASATAAPSTRTTICLLERERWAEVATRTRLPETDGLMARTPPDADGNYLAAPDHMGTGGLMMGNIDGKRRTRIKDSASKTSMFTGHITQDYVTFREYAGPMSEDTNHAYAYVRASGKLVDLGVGTFVGHDAFDEHHGELIWLQNGPKGRTLYAWRPGDKAPRVIAEGPISIARFTPTGDVAWTDTTADGRVHVINSRDGRETEVPRGLRIPEPMAYTDVADDGGVIMATTDGMRLYYAKDLDSPPEKVWDNDSPLGMIIDGVSISNTGFTFFTNGRGNRYVDRTTLVGIQVTPLGFSKLSGSSVLVSYPKGEPDSEVYNRDRDFRGSASEANVYTFTPGKMVPCESGATEKPPVPPT